MARERQLNPADRLERLLELGNSECAWCGYDLTKTNARATRDHLIPKIKGGPTRLENEVAACGSCNQKRGHATVSSWIEDCRHERGLEPNVQLVVDQLERLNSAIESEGGMRKVRDTVKRELDRAKKLV